MFTGGQVRSLSGAAGGAASPTACDFEPNNWLKRSPIEEPESEEAMSVLPPPHPDRTAPATASIHATRRRAAGAARAVRIQPLRFIRGPQDHQSFAARLMAAHAGRLIAGQWRRTQGG